MDSAQSKLKKLAVFCIVVQLLIAFLMCWVLLNPADITLLPVLFWVCLPVFLVVGAITMAAYYSVRMDARHLITPLLSFFFYLPLPLIICVYLLVRTGSS